MSGDVPSKIRLNIATASPSMTQAQFHAVTPNSTSSFSKVSAPVVSVPRDLPEPAAQPSLDARTDIHRRFPLFTGSLLRRRLSASAGMHPATGIAPVKTVKTGGAPHSLSHNSDGNALPIQLGPGSEVRVLKTSGGTVTVRSLEAPPKQRTAPLAFKAMEGGRDTAANTYKVTSSGTFVPYNLQSKGKEGSAAPPVSSAVQLNRPSVSPVVTAISASPNVLPSAGTKPETRSIHITKLRLPDNAVVAASEAHANKKNLAVVLPQVRPRPLPRPILPKEVVKDCSILKAAIQGSTISLEQSRLSGGVGTDTVTPANKVVPQPDARILGPSKTTAPKPVAENTEGESAKNSRVILIDLTESPTDANRDSGVTEQSSMKQCTTKQFVAKQSVTKQSVTKQPVTKQSSFRDSDVEGISPVVTEVLPWDVGCLQVPSGLKVDFINLDDLLIKDLNYLVKYFGESILEPLSMEDIANKGLSEWIDISNESEVKRTFLELEALNGSSTTQHSWTPQLVREGSDVAYPIVVPDFEDMGTSDLAVCQESSTPAESKVVNASCIARGLKDPPAKSPLILIIKKGASSSGSSPAWQLSAYRKATGKESGDSKASFLTGLDLLPSSGEQLKKMRKGKSARSLAVLKDKVMTEYLKNHHVPLHRVQAMYRYLFKKGHLKEGKLTYACEVYRNLRSRESRQRPVTMSLYEADDFSRKGSSSGLLWHLKPKKTCSKYEYDEDYMPRKTQSGASKLRRSLWGRPRVHWRTAAARNSALQQRSSDTCDAPPYKLEQGNWTPKCTDKTKDWSIWVSVNSRESKMAHPIPMVLLRRVDEAARPLPQRPTPVTELYCEQCSYSCLNKASLNKHFSDEHEGLPVSFEEVVISCRPNRTGLLGNRCGDT
ncbi:uncharacterized protein LOC8027016 [Ixodes scapularis]|uniref:uncharacterized protein LOC8027016 n=1 Tax=Ixodes scapularis TaxID=6945 RepID=UPI001A9E8E42|nr:uncharacterized protein LOC8027016 [Ixodes scapularis]XP_040064584.1 uncharacterized protein LOC8027016 [Ixodes scapularis]XP_042144738.1 uncharacterized protein LOC8027016 [Ixodes scapularis]